MRAPLATALLLLLLLATASVALSVGPLAAPMPGKTLKRVVALHRHGARTPMGVVNGSLVCDGPNYCTLTPEGIDMCVSLGRHLGAAYKGPLGFPALYNVSYMLSTATEYARVAMSGEAVVMGMFEGTDALPFVDWVPRRQDTNLVMWNSWPSYVLSNQYGAAIGGPLAQRTRQLLGDAQLAAIGAQFGLQAMCAASPVECALYAEDTLACAASMANPPPLPAWLVSNRSIYQTVASWFISAAMGYNPATSNFSASVGSYGYPFVTSALGYFGATFEALDPNEFTAMQHFAAHDWTLTAVYSALGIWRPGDSGNATFVPRFAEALILESWADNATGALTVRGFWGTPEQGAGTPHNYTFLPAPMLCLANGSSTPYEALANGGACPIEDLRNFVETTRPQSPLGGQCYWDEGVLKAGACDTAAAPAAASPCLFFRQTCVAAPCGGTPDAIADPANGYRCERRQAQSQSGPYMAATIVALVAPSLLAGAIAGFYASGRIRRALWGRRADAGSAASAIDDERAPIARSAGGDSTAERM